MLSYFPECRQEELFYSVIARYAEHIRLEHSPLLQKHLFNKSGFIVNIEMPRALNTLVEQMPSNNRLDADNLINGHTLAPMYFPFVSSDLRDAARRAMHDNGDKHIQHIIGQNGKVQAAYCLRFCPVCWECDQRTYGEPFWRRSHQAPGVEVCAEHHVFLEASKAKRPVSSSQHILHSARASFEEVSPHKITLSDCDHLALLEIAQDVNWLLANNRYYPHLDLLRRRYAELMHERGLAVSDHRIFHGPLKKAINDHFSDVILEKLGCPINEGAKCYWVMRLIRQRGKKTQHPLQHLVLIHALGFTAESFFTSLCEQPTRFGKGPWPCENLICPKYRQRIICDYKLYWKNKNKELRGIFCCPECEYSYCAHGIIDSLQDPFRVSRCMDRGKLWNSRFKQLWHDKTQTLYQIEKALGCSRKSLTRCAVIAGFPPHNGEYQGECSIYAEAVSARLQGRVKTKQNKRALWLNLLRQNPNASIKQLELLQKQLYSWMVHYDRIWLTQNRPVVRRRGRIVGHKHCLEDWTSRDREYSVMVKQAAAKLKLRVGRPTWISARAIYGAMSIACMEQSGSSAFSTDLIRALPRLRSLRTSWKDTKWMAKHLPLTQRRLREYVESATDFARRKLVWTAEECRKRAIRVTKLQLVKMAGVRTITRNINTRPETKQLNSLVDELYSYICSL